MRAWRTLLVMLLMVFLFLPTTEALSAMEMKTHLSFVDIVHEENLAVNLDVGLCVMKSDFNTITIFGYKYSGSDKSTSDISIPGDKIWKLCAIEEEF